MKGIRKAGLFALLIGIFVSPCGKAAYSGQLVEIWGSTTCQKRFLEPAAQNLKRATGIEIIVNGVGTGKGLIGLIDGRVNVSAASEDLDGAVNSARKVAVEASRDIEVPDNLVFHEIMRDHIIPIVHKDNPVSNLTWRQLRDLHTGKISNWREVGGPDMPVQVITSHTGSATRAVFQNIVMDKKDYAFDAIVVDSTRKEIIAVSKNRAAIGAVSAGFLTMFSGDTKPVVTEKITRPLGLITIGEPDRQVEKVVEYLRSEVAARVYN
jgi:phosphate transport system substrate-binding protein